MKIDSLTRLLAGLAALSATALGLGALAAWPFGFWRSVSFGPELLPMAPATAILIVVLGLWLSARAKWQDSRAVAVAGMAGSAVALFSSAFVLVQPWPSIAMPWDIWLPVQDIHLGAIPIGWMSPLTAVAFVLTSVTPLLQGTRFSPRTWARWLSRLTAAAGFLIGLVVTLGYVSGTPLYYGTEIIPMALLTALAFMALSTGLLLLGLRDGFQRARSFHLVTTPGPDPNRIFKRQIVFAAAAISASITLFGLFSLRHKQSVARKALFAQLDAIAGQKAQGIAVWRRERLSDARFLQRTSAVRQDVTALVAQPSDPESRARVLGWLETIKGGSRYESVLVFDPRANLVLGIPDSRDPSTHLLSPELLAQALAGEEVIVTDLHRFAPGESIRLDLIVPIRPVPLAGSPSTPAAIAVVVLRLNPEQDLYPFVQSWPGASRTGEILLLRREGDEAMILNPLRHQPGAALTKRQAVSQAILAASADARDDVDAHEGLDYRQIAVIFSIRKIPDSPWILAAKIDQTEAYAPIWAEAWQANASVAFLLLAVVGAAAFVWRHRDAELLGRALASDRERGAVAERLALVTQHANDIIFFMDETGRILEANDRALSAYGYTLEELRALPPGSLRAASARADIEQQFKLMNSPGGVIFETLHRRKDGTEFPVEVSGRVATSGGRPCLLGIYRDISERKRMDRQIASQEARFRFIFEHAPVGISLTSDAGCELVNQEHVRISGVSPADSVLPNAFAAASHPEDYARQLQAAEKFLNGEVDHFSVEKRYLHRNGAVFWAQLTSRHFIDPVTNQKKAVTTIVDITERKVHQHQIEHLNRRYLALSQINHALAQRSTPAALLAEVCRVLVETGGFKIAWVAWPDPATQRLNPIAIAGDETGYVSGVHLSTDPHMAEGQGPAGLALRKGRTCVCNDLFGDPAMQPWRDDAEHHGVRSLIALPLRQDGAIPGVLIVCAATQHAFGPEETARLEETVRDVSFGLSVFAADERRRGAEGALRASESRLQFLLSATPAVIYALRASGDFGTIFISRNVRELLGYEPEAFTSDPEFRLARLHPDDARSVDTSFTITSTSGAITREYRFRHSDGSYRWMHDEMRLVRDSQGRPQEFVGYWHDITERKQAEEKLRKLSRIIEKAPLSVIITDLVGTIEYVNPKFCTVTGYGAKEVLGRNPRLLKSGETPPAVHHSLWQTITRGEVWSGELRNRRKNGEIFLENVVIAPLADETGRVTHYVALKDDITAQRRFEAETTLSLAKEREVSELKTRFISLTSHEFRTPMAAAMGSVEILANHLDRLLPAKRQELLGRITASLQRMNDMLDDVLTLNRMDAKPTEVRPVAVQLWDFARNLIEEIQIGDHGAHRFELHTSGDSGDFVTDATLIHHIVSNLLSNAVRYSAAGTLVTVRVKTAGHQAWVTIEDRGIGIPPADRARIFESFERGSNVGSVKGTGLGLNIVQRMTDLLGGTISVESTVGRGSQFTVTLPCLQLTPPPT